MNEGETMDRASNEFDFSDVISGIEPADERAAQAAWAHWDNLCKPLRGLGKLEEEIVRIAAMQRTDRPHMNKRAAVIFGADNGVVEEGVSQTGSEVTRQVLENMGDHKSTVCVMSLYNNTEVIPVDVGMNHPASHPAVRNLAKRRGTGNIAKGPAMSRQDALEAVITGMKLAMELASEGYDLLIAGEMGIGNTTTSAACACVLFDAEPSFVTGRGAGLSGSGLAKKVQVVEKAVRINRPDPADPLDICSKVGGLDIAAMTGLFLGGAAGHIPVLIDGLISGISACLACMIAPASRDYMAATHAPSEPAGKLIFERLGFEPLLHAGMHLGEGSGAAVYLPVLDQALNVYNNLASFDDGKVKKYEHLQ